jgi:hypothetical protein
LPTAELSASRQTIFEKKILCRLPRNQQSAKPAVRAALCRLPRGFAVGKAFADWVYAFADRGKQSAKRRFPVVFAS